MLSDDRVARLTAVLDDVGWRSASDVPAAEVAEELDQILARGAAVAWDAATLRSHVAESLRRHAHPLDGSSSPAAAWHPTAAEIIRRAAAT